MKSTIKILVVALTAILAPVTNVQAQGLKDILGKIGSGGKDVGTTIGNLVEGVFSKSDLQVSDIVGDYESTGPAVTFKSDNLLKKAGGVATAAAVETKLAPYYKQYGLTGMKMTVNEDSTFTMNIKLLKLSGDVVRNDDKTFTFNIKAMGMKVGQFTAYVQKSGSKLDLMFDADKMKQFISMVTKLTGNKMASTAGKVLDSYDGMNVGFKLEPVK